MVVLGEPRSDLGTIGGVHRGGVLVTDLSTLTDTDTILAAHRPGILTTCDCEPGSSKWFEHCWASELEAARKVVVASRARLKSQAACRNSASGSNWINLEKADARLEESVAEYDRVMEEQR